MRRLERVDYKAKAVLRQRDLADQQDYETRLRQLHNCTHHIHGVVRGLDIVKESDSIVRILPGVAVDAAGRELILSAPKEITRRDFDSIGNALYVYISYVEHTQAATDEHFSGRIIEDAKVTFDFNLIHSRNPNIPDNASTYTPIAIDINPPPVTLGMVTRIEPADTPDKYDYEIDLSEREYAGLRAGKIFSPDQATALYLGPHAFEVCFRDTPNGAKPREETRLSATSDGVIKLNANRVTVNSGPLVLRRSKLRFQSAGKVDSQQSFSAYLTTHPLTEKEQALTSETDVNAAQKPRPNSINELRIELGTTTEKQTGLPMRSQFVVGAFSVQDKIFNPVLTVRDDGVVIVNGTLTVGTFVPKGELASTLAQLPEAIKQIVELKPETLPAFQEALKEWLKHPTLPGFLETIDSIFKVVQEGPNNDAQPDR